MQNNSETKKTYHTPELKVYGTLTNLTLAGPSSPNAVPDGQPFGYAAAAPTS